MFGSLFNPEALVWRWMSHLADVLVLSLLWLLLSLPLFTLGAATTALYDAAARCVRRGNHGAWRRFFHTFRAEFLTSTLVTVVWGLLLSGLFWIFRQLWAAALAVGAGMSVVAAAYLVALLIPAGAFCWMFPLLSRFTFRPLGLIWTSLQFSLAHLPSTAAVVLFTLAAGVASGYLLLPMLVSPCLTALFWSLLMERAFDRHMPERPLEE